MAWDFASDGSGGGLAYFVAPGEPAFVAPAGPGLLYEWTTTTSGDAPPGVDAPTILALQLQAIGFSAAYGETSAAPSGATIEEVLRWGDGRERITPIAPPQASSTRVATEDLAGLASVSIRVAGLPDGATYEVTSTYDPSKTWAAVCGTQLDFSSPAPAPEPFHWGPYFEGPETAEFRCLAVLPREDEDVIPVSVQTGVGAFATTVEWGPASLPAEARQNAIDGDFGSGGVLIEVTSDLFEGSGTPEFAPVYPGWTMNGSGSDGNWTAATTFGGLAWIDDAGRIIGREVMVDQGVQEPSAAGTRPAIRQLADLGTVDGRDRALFLRDNIATAGVPCDGVDPAALASASVVWIQGAGPDADHMTWSWTRVWPPSQN